MKIFFFMRHTGYVRLFDSVIENLLKQGHEIRLGFLREQALHPVEKILDRFKDYSNFDFQKLPKQRDKWTFLRKILRRTQDYLRYQLPDYERYPKLKKRAAERLPWLWRLVLGLLTDKNRQKIKKWTLRFRQWDQSLPQHRVIENYLKRENPDLFLITPLVDFGASQLDWLRGAKKLKINTALCVASWDNLTNKGIIQEAPDKIFVWNEHQKDEAIHFHNMPEANILVTGAQCFDRWFQGKSEISQEVFCARLGLPERPYLLYVCSSPFIAPDEVQFVRNWIQYIRLHPIQRLSQMGILIRPHPQNSEIWQDFMTSPNDDVALYPYPGVVPIDKSSISDYYESIYHSSGVVGVNTTAMIEAAILNKPVFTILSEEFQETQEGTHHFHYLMEGGWLFVSSQLREHGDQIAKSLFTDRDMRLQKRFVQRFLRPHGVDVPATNIMTEEILKMKEGAFVA